MLVLSPAGLTASVPTLASLLAQPAVGPTVTDLFCGAGGSSLAALWAGYRVAMAINHWPLSVSTHARNLGAVSEHDCADISLVDPRRYRRTQVLIASPECIGYSTAKNASDTMQLPHDLDRQAAWERSRALMEEVPRWAAVHGYDAVIVENVVDARQWGPSWDRKSGVLFDAWLATMTALGYEHQVVYLNAMVVPAVPQSRDRMYVVFWRRGLPAPDLNITARGLCERCEADVDAVQTFKTHTKTYRRWGQWGRYGVHGQYLYRCPTCAEPVRPRTLPAMDYLNLDNPGARIAERSDEALKDKTLARVDAGLARNGAAMQIVNTCYPGVKVPRLASAPFPTMTAQAENYLLTVPDDAIGPDGRIDRDGCRFRMIDPPEAQSAMAFPSDYRVLGSRRARQRQLGNAVCPPAMRLLLDRVRPTVQAAG